MIVTDIFDNLCASYVPDHTTNETFIAMMVDYIHEIYRGTGYLSLNEARKIIGLPATGSGYILGWIHHRDKQPYVYISEDHVNNGDPASIKVIFDVGPIIRDLKEIV